MVFNALIGNHDAHAKNFSLLYTGKAPVLAPSYDWLSTAVYPSLARKMAMKIGSKYVFSEVEGRRVGSKPIRRTVLATSRSFGESSP